MDTPRNVLPAVWISLSAVQLTHKILTMTPLIRTMKLKWYGHQKGHMPTPYWVEDVEHDSCRLGSLTFRPTCTLKYISESWKKSILRQIEWIFCLLKSSKIFTCPYTALSKNENKIFNVVHLGDLYMIAGGRDTQSSFFSFENKTLESVFWLSLLVPMTEQNSEMGGPWWPSLPWCHLLGFSRTLSWHFELWWLFSSHLDKSRENVTSLMSHW